MSHKQLFFRAAAREKILRGATALADAVRVTLGPKSKCVLIEKKWGKPIVCDDGVTIAKEFELKDPEENLGAQVVREAAEKTGDAVGDGTSTATILAYAIYSEGLRNLAAGASAVDLKRGLDRGLRVAVESIKGMSRPVSTGNGDRAPAAAQAFVRDAAAGPARSRSTGPALSKDAFRREQQRIDADLERLGARRGELEAALADPAVLGNFVELRRLTSELAGVDEALGLAEDAWLALQERAPR